MAGLFKSARDKLNKTGKKWKKQSEKLVGNEGTITYKKYGEFYNELYNFTKKLNDNYRYIIDKLAYFEKNYKVSDSQMKSIFESLNSMQKEVLKEYYSIEADELGGRLNKKNKQNTQDIHSNKIAQLTTNLDDTCSSIKDILNNCFALENYIKTADEYKLCLEQEKYFIENGWEVSPRDELAKIEHDIKECEKYVKACKKTISDVIDNNLGKELIDRQNRLFDTLNDNIQPKLQEQKDYLSIKVNKAIELNGKIPDKEKETFQSYPESSVIDRHNSENYNQILNAISKKLKNGNMLAEDDIEVVAKIYQKSVILNLDISIKENLADYFYKPNDNYNPDENQNHNDNYNLDENQNHIEGNSQNEEDVPIIYKGTLEGLRTFADMVFSEKANKPYDENNLKPVKKYWVVNNTRQENNDIPQRQNSNLQRPK